MMADVQDGEEVETLDEEIIFTLDGEEYHSKEMEDDVDELKPDEEEMDPQEEDEFYTPEEELDNPEEDFDNPEEMDVLDETDVDPNEGDIANDVEELLEEGHISIIDVKDPVDCWTAQTIRLLIIIRLSMEAEFMSPKKLKHSLWEQISEEILEKSNIKYSIEQCQKKFYNLNQTYVRNKAKQQKRNSMVINWRYFKMFDAVYGNKHNGVSLPKTTPPYRPIAPITIIPPTSISSNNYPMHVPKLHPTTVPTTSLPSSNFYTLTSPLTITNSTNQSPWLKSFLEKKMEEERVSRVEDNAFRAQVHAQNVALENRRLAIREKALALKERELDLQEIKVAAIKELVKINKHLINNTKKEI